MLSKKGKYLIALAVAALLCAVVPAADLPVSRLKFSSLKRIKADNWNIVGQNIVVRGNVYVPFGDFEIFADQAVINVESKDIEATGNIRFLRWVNASGSVDAAKLARLETAPDILVSISGITGNIWGEKSISVKASGISDNMHAERLVGNLETGYFLFEKARLKFKSFVCKAETGERKPDGVIVVKNAEVSACEYLENDNAHYSISCAEAKLTPHATEFYGLDSIEKDIGDHTILIFNGFARVYGVPVLWMPVFYKPKDESPGLFGIQAGKDGDWGYYILTYKNFVLSEYPQASVKLMADYYTKRGFGYGATSVIATEESRTEIFAYSIYDRDVYANDDYFLYRLKVPSARYDFRISNVTHITPRLDFRGVFEMSSDFYFTRDFFSSRYAADPQPATYAALEQQFDHFSASFYIRPRVNSFYTTVERLPGFQLSVPRQELFGTNFYYQGDFSMDYLKMNWIDFDRDFGLDGKEHHVSQDFLNRSVLKNYESFRLDNVNFLYYPLRFDWLTIVPRAGFRMTAYSRTSKTKVDEDDLLNLFRAANPESSSPIPVINYDDKGSSKLRFAGELGVEASTKIHNTWQDVKSTWLVLDGLRHVMQPYVNYTFIPKPTVDRDRLYYFDDIDRIDEQHFVRLGVNNRLQTRSGNSIRDYIRMENYLDVYFNKSDNHQNRLGEFCTILTATPFKGFSINTLFAIDIGDNNEEAPEVYRRGRPAGHPGIDLKWLNRWNISLNYSPAEDYTFTLSYNYHRPYSTRSAYSMGSTLTQLEAGSFFDKNFDEYSETLNFGFRLPLTQDRRTFGAYRITYDLQEGAIDNHGFMISRNFHCWELVIGLEFERDDDDKKFDTSFTCMAYLTGLTTPLQEGQNAILTAADREIRTPGALGQQIGF